MEPEGTVEVKFRRKDPEKTMQRLDKTCNQIVEKLTSPQLNPDEKAELQKRLAARQEKLLPMYHQVAIQFADLHDTSGRMEETGVITVSVKSCGVGNMLIDNSGNINVRINFSFEAHLF